MHPGSLDLSIVIPSYNEEKRLPATLQRITAYLKTSGRRAEVIVVDDGSTDQTIKAAESFQGQFENLRIVSNGRNRVTAYGTARWRRTAKLYCLPTRTSRRRLRKPTNCWQKWMSTTLPSVRER